MYSGPVKPGMIDAPLLSKILWDLGSHLHSNTSICLIGGSALTVLGIRKAGSEDVDFIALDTHDDFESSMGAVAGSIRNGHLGVTITHDGKTVKQFLIHKDTIIQVFGTEMSISRNENLSLPKDFTKYIHKVKKLKWVFPEGGREGYLSSDDILSNLTVYTLGLHDLLCTKIFSPREKDIRDLQTLFREIPLSMKFFSLRKKVLAERFVAFVKENAEKKSLVTNGIVHYEFFRKNNPRLIEKLPADIINAYPVPEDVKQRYGLTQFWH